MLSGALGLQIIARRLGVELGEQQFSKISDIDSREISLGDIKKLASNHSIICRAIKSNLSGLSEAVKKQPVLALLKNFRYVIVLRVDLANGDDSEITVIDPKAANPIPEKVQVRKFKEQWSGKGLIFRKSKQLEKNTGQASISSILDDLFENKFLVAQLLLIIIFINIFALAPTVFLMITLDKVVGYESYSTLYVVTSGVILAHVFNFFLSYYKSAIINLAAAKIEAKYGMEVFQQIIHLPISTFEKQQSQLTQLGQSLNSIRTMIISKLLGVITDVFALVIFTPILLFYSPVLGAIVIAFCLSNSLITAIHGKRSQILSKKFNSDTGNRQKLLSATSQGFVDIRRLGLEKDIVNEFKQIEGEFLRSNDNNLASNALINEFGTLMNNVMTVVVLFVGVHLVFAGSLSAGVLIGANMLIGKIFRPSQTLVKFPGEMKKLSETLNSVTASSSLSRENQKGGNFNDIIGSFKLQDVTLANRDKENILTDINLSIDINDTLGVCARQPETATAFAHLLQGLLRPTEGSIMVDGSDINTFNLQHFRSSVALVDRTNHFFAGTIRDNFQRVLPNANNDRIAWACGMANLQAAMDEINVTVDSDIDELEALGGENFKLKLSLARALIRNPKILILDDVISAMDSDSVLQFKKSFPKLSKGRTVVLISRNVYDLTICKKIAFFEGPKLVQFGNSNDVIIEDGPTKKLLLKQLCVINPSFEKHANEIVEA